MNFPTDAPASTQTLAFSSIITIRPGIRAFSLVEVTLALAITSFCCLVLLGLLATGLIGNRAALSQTAANGILSSVAADLRATPPTSPPGQSTTTQLYGIPIPANPVTTPTTNTLYFPDVGQLASASAPITNASAANSHYLMTIVFQTNGTSGTPTRAATVVNLEVSWPAEAGAASAAGSVHTLVVLDRN